ncbi:MAG: hypothetical protein ACOC5A_00955 [Halanaerobiales bacterium]
MDQQKIISRYKLTLELINEFELKNNPVFLNKGDPFIDYGEKTKKKYRDKLMEKLNSYVSYEGKKHKLKSVIQKQARHIATFLRGERDYHPFRGKW